MLAFSVTVSLTVLSHGSRKGSSVENNDGSADKLTAIYCELERGGRSSKRDATGRNRRYDWYGPGVSAKWVEGLASWEQRDHRHEEGQTEDR